MTEASRRHLAVLGAGPKALFALEELTARLPACSHSSRWCITVIEPGEEAGTGAAYRTDQPDVLRLNVTASILDAPAGGSFPALTDWLATPDPMLPEQTYPPRAHVGRYLAARWEAMREDLARRADVRVVAARAHAVRPSGSRWTVETAPTYPLQEFDEVLVATGHGSGHEGALAASWRAPLALRPAVLPVESMLAEADVPAGSRVATRGAALTFLDAALALTEGRGGAFLPDPHRPGRLRHRRSPREPATLLPTARHGLLLDAKPDPGTPAAEVDLDLLANAEHRLSEPDPAGAQVSQHVVTVVAHTAAQMLGGRNALSAVQSTLATGMAPDTAGSAARALQHSVDIALGRSTPGPAWVLGRTWSHLYPAITELLRGNNLPALQWTQLRRSAQVLERFAFGPPLITAQKLLAMIDSGAVDLSWLDHGTLLTPTGTKGHPKGSPDANVVVDAVLPPPGLLSLTDPLARQMLHDGLVTVRPGRRGAAVDTDGTALDGAGRRQEHLALIGRPTEDHVIGHDTLNRHLHHEIQHWAQRLSGGQHHEGEVP